MSDKTTVWEELAKPFPKEAVGILPKPYKKDSQKGECSECNGYHGLPAVHLDYVGHANVTDRLNAVVKPDGWNWEPMAKDELGLPKLDADGNLWIYLTINGVTKPGVGDGYNMKERIGDALRNAAMRFGVALDLWTKDELESHIEAPELNNEKPSGSSNAYAQTFAPYQPKPINENLSLTPATQTKLGTAVKLKGITDKQHIVNILNNLANTTYGVPVFMGLTEAQALETLEAIGRMNRDTLDMLVDA